MTQSWGDASALAALMTARRNQLNRSWDEVGRRAADEVLHVSVDDLRGLLNDELTEIPDAMLLQAVSVGLELPLEDVFEAAVHSLKPPQRRPGTW